MIVSKQFVIVIALFIFVETFIMKTNLKKTSVIERKPLNRDLSTWRKQIKAAIKQGQTPEKSVWGNRLTEQEEKEWT